MSGKSEKIVIRLSGDTMGRGDDELGKRLINSFLNVLNESSKTPEAVVLFNSGVKLACEGASTLEALNDLSEKGVTILNCGTCLNHFGLNKKLRVGKESNMYEITETMMNADKVIPL